MNHTSRYIIDLEGIGEKLMNDIRTASLLTEFRLDDPNFLNQLLYMYEEFFQQMFQVIDREFSDYALCILELPDFRPFVHLNFIDNVEAEKVIKDSFRETAIMLYQIIKNFIPSLGSANSEVLLENVNFSYMVILLSVNDNYKL